MGMTFWLLQVEAALRRWHKGWRIIARFTWLKQCWLLSKRCQAAST